MPNEPRNLSGKKRGKYLHFPGSHPRQTRFEEWPARRRKEVYIDVAEWDASLDGERPGLTQATHI